MRFIAIAALAASTLCFAQTSAQKVSGDSTPYAQQPCDPKNPGSGEGCAPATPTVAEIEQQIKTLIATRQVYYERLDKITEFLKYTQANEQIGELQKQERQIVAAQRPANTKAEDKKAEADFKKNMAAAVEREKKK